MDKLYQQLKNLGLRPEKIETGLGYITEIHIPKFENSKSVIKIWIDSTGNICLLKGKETTYQKFSFDRDLLIHLLTPLTEIRCDKIIKYFNKTYGMKQKDVGAYLFPNAENIQQKTSSTISKIPTAKPEQQYYFILKLASFEPKS